MITIQKKSLRVGKYVDTAYVDAAIRNYKKERWVHNSEHIGKEDSLSVWFSAEEIQEFLDKIKEYGGDGIKFYFGAYPADFPEKPEYAGRQTIVLVGTKRKEMENGGFADKDMYITRNGVTSIFSVNSGRLCPPICGGFAALGKGLTDVGVTIIDRGEKGVSVV
ncbi:MAG: hypothetical protein C5B59_20900 [Bacteroidetes bacterium]|nr:MAG: hypothetical protein C5B59_20900 [Bacteroidota bacterium]